MLTCLSAHVEMSPLAVKMFSVCILQSRSVSGFVLIAPEGASYAQFYSCRWGCTCTYLHAHTYATPNADLLDLFLYFYLNTNFVPEKQSAILASKHNLVYYQK